MKGLLLPYFKVFQRRCSKALANEFLYWMMMQILNGCSLTMSYYPEFPGLYLQAEDGAIKDIDYVCSDGEDEAVVPYLSPNYLHKTLPFTDKSCTQLLAEVQPYLTGNAVAEIFHAKLPDGCKDYLAKCIVDSQNMETGKELAVVNEFFRQLNCDISSGVLSIAELGRDMAFREKQNIIIHDDDLLLMEESTVKDVILPHMTTAATVNGILTALAAEGYLISTNGHRKPTTVYDENRIPKQLKLIAFRYQEMVSSDLLRYIESMKTKQY